MPKSKKPAKNPNEERFRLIDEYFRLTSEVLPKKATEENWAALEEAHFQRIILDNICGGVWYGKLKEPAIMHMSKSQLKKAVRMAEDLAFDLLSFDDLNEPSLKWREEKNVPPDIEYYRAHSAKRTENGKR